MNDYPVKYALVPFYNNDLCGYIALKCYVLDIKKEKDNDSFKTYYRISYPVDNDNFNYEVGITDNIYNSYEEAKEIKSEKNRKLLNEKVESCFLEDRRKMYIKYRKDLEEMENFEKLISNYGKDLNVTKGKIRRR